MFLGQINAQALHVQYKGSGPALNALISGEIDMLFDNYATAISFANSDQVKALALTSADTGSLNTTLPTLAVSGMPKFESLTWIGMLAPAGTPAATVAWINAEVAAVLSDRTLVARLTEMGLSPRRTTPETFGAFLRQQTSKVQQLVRENGIALE